MVGAGCSGYGFGRRQWVPLKKDGMECDDGIVAPFCFPFFTMVKGRSESMTMLIAGTEVKIGERNWHQHQADAPWWLALSM